MRELAPVAIDHIEVTRDWTLYLHTTIQKNSEVIEQGQRHCRHCHIQILHCVLSDGNNLRKQWIYWNVWVNCNENKVLQCIHKFAKRLQALQTERYLYTAVENRPNVRSSVP